MAAVSVNCLAATINGRAANDTVAVPYIDMLLPPLEDAAVANKDAAINIDATVKPRTTTTTKKPLINYENNVLPELSIEALVPPLFEAKIEKQDTTKITKTTTTTTTTTKRPNTTTTKKTTTTAKPFHSTTINLKPSKLKVPDLFLEPLQPLLPVHDNNIVEIRDEKASKTTQQPTTTTTTSHQQTERFKDQSETYNKNYPTQSQQPFKNHTPANSAGNEAKKYNKPAAATTTHNDKQTAESQTHTKRVSLTDQQANAELPSKTVAATQQYVAKQKANNSKNHVKQLNYTFDLYLGSTTPRPPKNGLPTITPFPRRL